VRATVIVGFTVALLSSSALAESRLSGNEAEALAIAVQTFKSKQGSKIDGAPVYGDLRRYTNGVISLQRRRAGDWSFA